MALAQKLSSHGFRTPADLVDGINNLKIMHENHEQQFRQEIQTVEQQQDLKLEAIQSEMRNCREMFEKLQLERDVLMQRVRQLESGEGTGSRPSALPLGLPSSRAASFVQTVLGVHYEALGLHNTQERVRPVRLSALQREKMIGDMKDDSASEKEPRRSSKRQRPVKPAPSAQVTTDGPVLEDGTIPLVAKSGTRIRLKPIVAPKGEPDDEGSVDVSISELQAGDLPASGRTGIKRPRSPASSVQGPSKPAKKRNTASAGTRNKINIQTIPRAPDGTPLLPMQVGMFTLRNLGQIIGPDDLSTQKTLYPIGYQCERRWFSTVDPKALVTYVCTIEGGKDPQHPIFVVTPEDAAPETGHSATAAWWNIYKEGLRVRNQPEQAVMNGDEMFGLYDNVIKALLQELPGADKVSPYIWRTFIEGGPAAKRRNTANAVYHIESPVKTTEGSWIESQDATQAEPSQVSDPTSGPYVPEALSAPTSAV